MSTRFIYIIDDDDAVRDSLRSLLSVRTGLCIACYSSGEAFIESADDLEPGVVLLDYHMPVLSGVEVLRTLDRGKFLTIMLTGHASVGLATEVMRAGAADFLEKPYDPEALLRAVDAAFETLEHDRAAITRAKNALARLERLSEREREVLDGLIQGHANKVIAHDLDISPRTVEVHRAKLMDKLGVRSLSEALRLAFAAGIVPLD